MARNVFFKINGLYCDVFWSRAHRAVIIIYTYILFKLKYK